MTPNELRTKVAEAIADVLAEWPAEDSAEEHAPRVADAVIPLILDAAMNAVHTKYVQKFRPVFASEEEREATEDALAAIDKLRTKP